MKTYYLLILVLNLGFSACKNSEKEIDHLALTNRYFEILDTSKTSEIEDLLSDSLVTRENDYDYTYTFSKAAYVEWIRWDSVFDPNYKILNIAQDSNVVKVRVSKIDTRINFLHNAPIVTDQEFHFKEDKISAIVTTKYVVFNDSIFVKNRETFLNWMDQNHPDLNDFIFDQTKAGGLKYLKAIKLFKNNTID